MPTSIEDGTGQGYRAKVDDHGRLYVVNNNVSHLSHHTTWHKNAYIVPFSCTLGSTNETPIFVFENTDSAHDIELFHLGISATADMAIHIYAHSNYSTGGTEVTPVNTNFGASSSFSVSAYEGGASADLAVVTANEALIVPGHVQAYSSGFLDNFDGGVVLTNGYGLSVKAVGAATNVISGHLVFTMHEAGTKL